MMQCIYARCRQEIPDGSLYCPWCGRKQVRETKKRHRRANGTGSVYKNSGTRKRSKPWVALKDGHSIGQCFATEAEAKAALDALAEVRDVELWNLTMAGVYERWSQTAYKDCSKSFYSDKTNSWKHIPEQLRGKRFREVRAADMQAVLDELYEAGKSESLQNKVKTLYSALCAFGMSNDIISKNYASFLKVHSTERQRDTSIFSFSEIDLLLEKAGGDEWDRQVQTARIIVIYLFTTMRLSELLPLPCSAVHLDEQYPYIVGGEKTEAGRNRVIPVISTIQPYVRWFLEHATDERLFSAYAGSKTPRVWRVREYYPLLDALGIPRHTPHGTRRTTATMAVEAKVDPAALQKVGGWKEFDTIQRHYNKPDIEYLYHEMEKLEGIRKERGGRR